MNKLVLPILLFCLFASQASAESLQWKQIGEDLELAEAELSEGFFRNGRIIMIRTSLSKYRPEVVVARDYDKKTANVKYLSQKSKAPVVINANFFDEQNANVKYLSQKSKAPVVINANFFDEQNQPLGLVIHRGQKLNPMHQGGRTLTGIFSISRNGISIVHRSSFSPNRVVEALQAGPRLVVDNEPVAKLKKSSNRRAGLCIDTNNRLVLFAFTGNFLGLTHEELQRFLLEDSVRCKDALNLDGGGSAQLYVSKDILGASADFSEIYLPGTDDVPVGLGLFVQ